MKRSRRQAALAVFIAMICLLLSGCTVGRYHLLETFEDENGEQRFMGFGEIGPSGGEESGEEEPPAESSDAPQENETGGDLESITGTTLKRGWTSSDPSILKGKNVTVKKDSVLFSIDLEREKQVAVSWDIRLEEGDYRLVYTGPDGTERILQNGETSQAEEKLLLTQGKNEISILSGRAVFREIDISLTGIETSDFQR